MGDHCGTHQNEQGVGNLGQKTKPQDLCGLTRLGKQAADTQSLRMSATDIFRLA